MSRPYEVCTPHGIHGAWAVSSAVCGGGLDCLFRLQVSFNVMDLDAGVFGSFSSQDVSFRK
jgi:hypothetical protein